MELINSFDVALPVAEAWDLLTDVERIVPCLPGALLREVEGNEYRGAVMLRVGPLTVEYTGTATIVEQHEVDHRIVVTGAGVDEGGSGAAGGNAEVSITARLEPLSDTTTRVNVDSDLRLTGRVEAMGGGVITEVNAAMMAQFAANLDALISGHGDLPAVTVHHTGDERARRRVEMPAPEAVDLLDAARTPVLKRLFVLVAVALAVTVVVRRRRRR
ncbi:MAG: SRPBCC family protein [Acidimicrobiales bacterium]